MNLRLHEPHIVNTDRTGGPGVHWIVLVKLRHGIIYLYDPLGPKNRLVDQYGRSVRSLIKANRQYPYETQIDTTSHCGYFAIFVARLIQDMVKSGSELTPTTITKAIEAHFGQSADWGDVKRMWQAVKKELK